MIINGAEPFLLPGSREHGILLIHGFTGSPSEMILLGDRLYHEGYTVLCPRLTGHGTTVEEMARTNRQQWYNSVCDAYHLLRGMCKEISVIGLSMGGLLTLNLGIDMPINKAVIMSAPVFLANERNLRFLPPKEQAIGKFQRKNRRHLPEVAKRYSISYEQMPLVCVHELLDLIKSTKEKMSKFTIPALVVQSDNDHTVNKESGPYIFDHIGSTQKEFLHLTYSGHIVTLDIEREKLFEKIIDFLRND